LNDVLYRCLKCGFLNHPSYYSFSPLDCCNCNSRGRFAIYGSTSEFYNWKLREDVCEMRDHISDSTKKFKQRFNSNLDIILKMCSACEKEFVTSGSNWEILNKEK